MGERELARRRNADLRAKLENEKAKREIETLAALEREKELKEAIRKRDNTISMLQKEISRLSLAESGLRGENEGLRGALEKALDDNSRLRAMMKKGCATSDIPPSQDPWGKPKASPDSGKKAGRKPGGQPGHKGHGLKPCPDPTEIVDIFPAPACECGGAIECVDEYVAKQKMDIRVVTDVTEERAYFGVCTKCGRRHHGAFSDAYVNPVHYGPGIKAFAAVLNAHANVPMNKTAGFIRSVTGGKVSISDGTVANILKELYRDLEPAAEYIKGMLVEGGLLHADETGVSLAGKASWMTILANDGFTLFSHGRKRSDFTVDGADPILLFTGILVHDHLSSYYKYTHLTHAECNVHIRRYLKAVIDILGHGWAKEMDALLCEADKKKKGLVAAGKKAFPARTANGFRNRYFAILDRGDREYKDAIEGKTHTTYYDEERKLLARLRAYAGQHLLFIFDFVAPFSNNTAEHGARYCKGKHKTGGCFRSAEGAAAYARIASVLSTAIKQGEDVYDAVLAVFNGGQPAFLKAG